MPEEPSRDQRKASRWPVIKRYSSSAPRSHRGSPDISIARVALALLLILFYLRFLIVENYFSPLDHVNLVFHEAGHVLFSPFGRFIMMLGGTISQLAIPLVCAIHFLRSSSVIGFQLALYWTGENFLNVSVYIADARRRALPLVGAGEHDWTYLLAELGLLTNDQQVAWLVFLSGSLLILYSIFRIIRDAFGFAGTGHTGGKG